MANLTLQTLTNAGDTTKNANLTAAEVDQNFINLDSAKVAKTGDTMTGTLNFSGSGLRLTGDFSNATVANRLMFQTSTANGNTAVGVIPNGTATTATANVYNNSDPANASFMQIQANSGATVLNSSAIGSGSLLPMTFFTGGSERARFDIFGSFGLGVTPNTNWSTSTKKVFQIGAGGYLYGDAATLDQIVIGANHYFDGTSVKYSSSSTATRMFLGNGSIALSVAPSGTGGTVATFVDAITINNTGRVTIGTASINPPLADNDLSFDMAARNNFTCTTAGTGTLTFTNITSGQSGFILLTNAANHAISAAATTKITATDLSRVSQTGTYLLSYFSNGTNVYVMASGNLA